MQRLTLLRSLTATLLMSAFAACSTPVMPGDGSADGRADTGPGIDAIDVTGMDVPRDNPADLGTDHQVLPDVTDSGGGCTATQHMCGSMCVDNTDPAFGCGATACTPCSIPNAMAGCSGAVCTVGTCNAGFADCDSTASNGCEVNTAVNNANCGSCGHACTASEMCMAGACVPASACTTSGEVRCGGTCTNTQTDSSNCGACGTVCPSGTTCTAGACHCSAAGSTLCGTTCVDTQTDGSNCGSCGMTCTSGATCTAGACVCASGQTNCSGTCRTLASDNANCGSCGNACGTGQSCTSGMCTCTTAGQTNCSGTCRDLSSDTANCGACGNACAAGRVCTAGVCGCPSGGMVCGAACANVLTDSANCGACGTVCGTGQTCTGGLCTCTTAGQLNCGGTCRTIATDSTNCGGCGITCGVGQTCTAGACVCPAGQTNCGGTCRTLATDTNNCGACGMACPAGQTCMSGTCMTTGVVCTGGQTNCGGTCRTLATDPNNCGGCGTVCPASLTCTGGACVCPAGQSNCGGSCVALGTDNNNCGACGMVCSGGRTCSGGACVCPAGQTFCGGACISTAANSTYCAPAGTTCGVSCTGGQVCSAGACACPAGLHMCGGTCIDTTTSNAYCATVASNSCGVTCTGGQSCVAGACTCPAGQHLCGGTCVDTTTNNTYCATAASMSCGVTCTSGRVCTAGACNCPAGTPTFCSGSMTCVNTTNDNNNCGACGMVCPVLNPVCVAGACTSMPPPNDLRANAQVIDLSQPATTYNTTFVGSTSNTTPPAGCLVAGTCNGGANGDVFYRFTLNQPELIYADTFGSRTGSASATDTIIFLQDSAGNPIASAGTTGGATCNDDQGSACSGGAVSNLDSRLVARLDGTVGGLTYYLVVKSCNATGTSAVVNFHHLPAGAGLARNITPGAATASVTGTTAGASAITPSCSSSSTAPEDVVWFTTCPSAPAQSIHTHSCGSAFDTVVYERSTTRAAPVEVCQDDNLSNACFRQSSVTAAIPAGTGLHAVYVDGYGSSAGAYTLTFQMPPCATGFTLCGGVCVDTQSANNNCGACGTVCGAGTTCNTGSCRPVNDDCAASYPGTTGATPVTLGAAGTTTTVTTGNNATNSTNSTSSHTPNGDVWFSFTTGPTRELVYINTFGTTTYDTYLEVRNTCGGAAIGTNDDSLCGAVCTAGAGCDYRSSSLAVVLDPGTHYLNVDAYGTPGAFSLAFQRITNVTAPVGVPANTIAAGSYAFTASTVGSPTRLQDCNAAATTTPSPENTYVWLTCPSATSGTFSATACDPLTTYDTLIEYRTGTSATPIACNDDQPLCSPTNRSAFTASTPAGATAHVFTVSGYGGLSGTARISGSRP